MSKYNYFNMIKYLFKATDAQFKKEFDIKDKNDIDLLAKFVKKAEVTNLD